MELLRPLDDVVYPTKTISATTSAAYTSDWPPGAQGVLVWSDAAIYVDVGPSVTATTSSTAIPANVPVPFYVEGLGTSQPWRVSARTITGTGTVYCKPMNIR
jgi:hypothetical protein